MRRELHAEWTKLRTVPGPGWLLLAVVAVTVAVSTLAASISAAAECPVTGCLQDPTLISLVGIPVGQAMVALLVVLVVCGEYGTGLIRITFTAMPRRGSVLAAKGVIVCALTAAAGGVSVLGGVLAGRLILPGRGFTPAHRYPLVSLAEGPTLRAAAGSVLYLVLIALLSLGISVAVRDSASAIAAVLGLLYLPSLMIRILPHDLREALFRALPMTAGLAIQATANLSDWPIAPWPGLGVLAAWSAAALLIGTLLLRHRDA